MTNRDVDIDTFNKVAAALRARDAGTFLAEVGFAGYPSLIPDTMQELHRTMHTNQFAKLTGPIAFAAVSTDLRNAYREFVEWAMEPGRSDHPPHILQAKIDTGFQFLDAHPTAVLVFAWAPAIRINN